MANSLPSSSSDHAVLADRPGFQLVSSRGFTEWMASVPLSLALTTYHRGGLIWLGTKPSGEASLHVAAFDRSMGCWTNGQTLWLVTERMLWRLENNLADGQVEDGYDRIFVPRVGYTTGEVDGHEVAVGSDGRPVFVNTRFSCIATIDERFNFRPLWHPPFISQLAPEDRCHLSGLAVVDGKPKYVTMHARSDVADGWRDFRETGGVVMDMETNEVVGSGLSMPHSPRVRDGRLWLLNSGTGHLGFIEPGTGKFEPVTFVPGYARGLAFHGDWAIVGLSKPRREHAFQGLPLEKNLAERGAAPRCGLCVIDLKSGATLHWARIESSMEELFDVAVLPGFRRPKALSFTTSTYAHQLSFMHGGKLQRWTVSPASDAGKLETQSGDKSPHSKGDPLAPRRTPQNTAKALNNLGLSHCEQGRLDEAKQCFEQAIEHDPQHAGAQNNLGNILRQQEQWEPAVECYRRALAADPNYARAYFNLGQTLVQLGRLPEAGGCFRRTLALEPQNVEAGVSLGMVLKDQGKLDEATHCFQQALQLDPQSWSAYNGLGLVHKERDELEPALECYDRALQFNPQAAAALANKGSTLRELGQLDAALACYDRALESDPQCVAAHHNRSMLRLLAGDFAQGWPEYEWRWKQPLRRHPFPDSPAWDGSPLAGRTILLFDEQGKGDAIQFVRYAPLVKQRGGRVILGVSPSLVPLFRSVQGVDELVSKEGPLPAHDVQAALMSLPACFGTTPATIPVAVPYLSPRADLVKRWKAELQNSEILPALDPRLSTLDRIKIGIAWQGNPDYPGDKHRSFPLACFAPLVQSAGVTLFSLQKGFGSEQLRDVAFPVIDLAARLDERTGAFEDTAAVMTQLDLIITCDTALAHLAGALGLPVWVALPQVADWRHMLDRDNDPWYPTMRLFRQQRRGDWNSVFQRMAAALAAMR